MTDRRVQGVVLIVVLVALCFGGWGLYQAGWSHGFWDGHIGVTAPAATVSASLAPAVQATPTGNPIQDARANAAPAVESGLTATSASAGAGADVVHATRSGKKYHRAGCRFLSKSDIPMSRSEAEGKGLTPCGVCQP